MAERDENTCREPMNGVEIATISQRLLAIEAPAAKARQENGQQKGGGDRKSAKAKRSLPVTVTGSASQPAGKAIEQVAAAVDVSPNSLRKAFVVLDALAADPEKYAAPGVHWGCSACLRASKRAPPVHP